MSIKLSILFAVISVLVLIPSYGKEYSPSPCPSDSNYIDNEYKNDILSGDISLFKGDVNNNMYLRWASSMLKPFGEPRGKNYKGEGYGDNVIERAGEQLRYDVWSCQYSAYSAMDGDTTTAWVEGVEGKGIGEMLIVDESISSKLEIWNGYGKSSSIYKSNNRVKEANIYTIVAERRSYSQVGPGYFDTSIIDTTKYVLDDLNGYRTIDLPEQNVPEKAVRSFVGIEILSVY